MSEPTATSPSAFPYGTYLNVLYPALEKIVLGR
jgi:hypothetical protein